MLIVDPEMLDSLLKNPEHYPAHPGYKPENVKEKDSEERGRNEGDTNIPEKVREVIGMASLLDTGANTAEAFGVSPNRVAQFKAGDVNHGDKRLSSKIEKFREQAQEQASQRLLSTLGVITDEEIEEASLKEKVYVADKMAAVVQRLDKRTPSEGAVANQVVIYAPRQNKIEDYEAINV